MKSKKSTLEQLTEEEFIDILEDNIETFQCKLQSLYKMYRTYLKDKEKNYLTYYKEDNIIKYTVQKKNPIGFRREK